MAIPNSTFFVLPYEHIIVIAFILLPLRLVSNMLLIINFLFGQ